MWKKTTVAWLRNIYSKAVKAPDSDPSMESLRGRGQARDVRVSCTGLACSSGLPETDLPVETLLIEVVACSVVAD